MMYTISKWVFHFGGLHGFTLRRLGREGGSWAVSFRFGVLFVFDLFCFWFWLRVKVVNAACAPPRPSAGQ